jgi:hypothetical protein
MHLARLLTLLAALILCAPSHAQTIKSLGVNTTNGFVVYGGTNALTFTNDTKIGSESISLEIVGSEIQIVSSASFEPLIIIPADDPVALGGGYWSSPENRAAFGFSTNLNTLWTATTSSNARSAVGLGATWLTNTDADTFRSNIALGLPALTNTSNVTFLSAVGAAQTIFSVRTNDLSITNETNATSTGLSFNTEPNARYVVTLYPIVFGNTEVQMVASNSTLFGQWNGLGTGFASTTELTNSRTFSSGSDNRGAFQTFYVEGGTNAGSISMTFRSSTATNTNTIKAGSFLRADRMP